MIKKDYKLTIELVPYSSWFTNLRSELSTNAWDKIRKSVYKNANYKCEICDSDGKTQKLTNWPVEAHEIWEYDDENHTQKLIGIQALCPKCHRVKHIGLAGINGQTEECIAHLININKITKTEAINYIDKAFETYRERSQHDWEIDLTLLDEIIEDNRGN